MVIKATITNMNYVYDYCSATPHITKYVKLVDSTTSTTSTTKVFTTSAPNIVPMSYHSWGQP